VKDSTYRSPLSLSGTQQLHCLKACTRRDITMVFAVLKSETKQTKKGWFVSPTVFSIAQCVNTEEILDLFTHHIMTMAGKCEEMALHLRQTARMFAA